MRGWDHNETTVICQGFGPNGTKAPHLNAAQIQSYPRLRYKPLWSREMKGGGEMEGTRGASST